MSLKTLFCKEKSAIESLASNQVVGMKMRAPVRHKSAGLPICAAERPEQREGEDHGWFESIRASVSDALSAPPPGREERPKAI